MKFYLEAKEIVGDDEQAEFIRSDITDMTDAEIAEVKAAMQDIMKGTTYKMFHHTCGHPGKKCEIVEI